MGHVIIPIFNNHHNFIRACDVVQPLPEALLLGKYCFCCCYLFHYSVLRFNSRLLLLLLSTSFKSKIEIYVCEKRKIHSSRCTCTSSLFRKIIWTFIAEKTKKKKVFSTFYAE